MRRPHRTALLAASAIAVAGGVCADLEGLFPGGLEHPTIGYRTRPVSDRVAQLNHEIQQGKARLEFQGGPGYLRSVLQALDVPVESQLLVFSKTSLMQRIINPGNPRSIFFNDSVAVAWVPGEPFVEAAAEDPRQGMIFYTLAQKPTAEPAFLRRDDCLTCHESYASLGVPGTLARSVFPAADGARIRPLGDFLSDHRSPFKERWGGWYVTGKDIQVAHMGNATAADRDLLAGKLPTDIYLSPYSDIAALMVFDHQMHMMNLLTRVGWEVRLACYEDRMKNLAELSEASRRLIADTARELVDYLLFIDEAAIDGYMQSTSGFAAKLSAQGPSDSHGRSLRQLDLHSRLMRYPCSYMIYTKAFDGLPDEALEAVYKRMWQVLSGEETSARYNRLSSADRLATIEILRETKKGLPRYFMP